MCGFPASNLKTDAINFSCTDSSSKSCIPERFQRKWEGQAATALLQFELRLQHYLSQCHRHAHQGNCTQSAIIANQSLLLM